MDSVFQLSALLLLFTGFGFFHFCTCSSNIYSSFLFRAEPFYHRISKIICFVLDSFCTAVYRMFAPKKKCVSSPPFVSFMNQKSGKCLHPCFVYKVLYLFNELRKKRVPLSLCMKKHNIGCLYDLSVLEVCMGRFTHNIAGIGNVDVLVDSLTCSSYKKQFEYPSQTPTCGWKHKIFL